MRLKKLGCKYFMHFGPFSEITFPEDVSIVSIVGQWADEPKRSNRSGKSSLVEAMLYGLYGKSRSKKEVGLINKNYPGEDMVVELTFDNNDEEIVIQRGRSSSNQIILELTGFEGADKKVVQDEIDRLVGLSYDDFIMTSFFLQGDIHTFMDAGATGQKQMIAKWLEKDYWKQYEKKAKEKVNELTKQINRLEVILEDKIDPLEDAQILTNINTLGVQKKSIETQVETLDGQLEAVVNQINKMDAREGIEHRIDRAKEMIWKTELRIKNIKEVIEQLNKELPEAVKREWAFAALKEREKELERLKAAHKQAKDDFNTVSKAAIEEGARLTDFRKQFNKVKKFDNICPVMMKPCTAIDSIEGAKDEMVNKGKTMAKYVKELDAKSNLLRDKVDATEKSYNDELEIVKEIRTYKKMETPEVVRGRLHHAQEELAELQEDLIEAHSSLERNTSKLAEFSDLDINLLKSQKNTISSEIAVKKTELDDIIISIASYNATLEHNKVQKDRIKKAEKEMKALSKKLNLYKYVSYMFSKNGIPSHQIETAFQDLEQESNIILEKINSDISIEFSAEREMGSWEDNCLICGFTFPKGFRKNECPGCNSERQKKRKEELQIKIITKGKEIDFNLESGGGKVLISLAIRLAFIRMLQRRLGVNLGLVVFDEIFGMLDSENRNYVLRLLADTLITDFGFSQIFVISHESEIRDVIPHLIKIIKHDEYSVFEWG
jgi:DNA repair exonuclease SbcCD ATPase subunit